MISGSEKPIKMKGLLKGLRFISQIFDSKEEDDEEDEEEMQIGLPTDVKHVAHIGWDGPSVTSPSWMTDFRPAPESASAPTPAPAPAPAGREAKEPSAQKPSAQAECTSTSCSIATHESTARDLPDLPLPKPTRRRRQSASASSFDASTQESPLDAVPKQTSRRQKQATSGLTMDSPGRDETAFDGVKPSKKSSKEHKEDSKQARRKKTKGSLGGESTKSRQETSTYTAPFSDPGTGSSKALKNKNSIEANCPTSAMNGLELGEKGCDTNSVS